MTEETAPLTQQKRFTLKPVQKTYLQRAVLLAMVIRIMLLAVGYLVDRGIMMHSAPFWDQTLHNIFHNWDALHYIKLAEEGYQYLGEDNYILAFFPLYPYLVKSAHFLIPHYLLAALVVSFACSVAVGYLLQDLMRIEGFDEDTIFKAFLFCFFFPTAIYTALPYSEALFLALVLYAFRAARLRNWLGAGMAGALACAARINGLFLIPALLLDALMLEKKDLFKKAYWLAFIPMGFVLYLYINWVFTGNPLAFIEIQKVHWGHEALTPWGQYMFTMGHVLYDKAGKGRFVFYEVRLIAMAIGFIGLLACLKLKEIRPSWHVFCWLCFWLSISAKHAISMPRYLWVLFPLFILLAKLAKRPLVFHALLSSSTLMMAAWFALFTSEKGGF